MNSIRKIKLLLILVISISSCKKDYFPEFETPIESVASFMNPSSELLLQKIKAINPLLHSYVLAQGIRTDKQVFSTTFLNLLHGECPEDSPNMAKYYNHNLPQLIELNGLEYFKNLNTLRVMGHKIRSINCLWKLKNLERINLRNNMIKDVSILWTFPKLTELDLGNNKIKNINGLRKNEKMLWIELGFSSNFDGGTEIFKNFPKLKHLGLSGCNVENLDGISKSNELITLLLHGNKIVDPSPINGLTSLKYLNLSNNRICSFDSIQNLVGSNTCKVITSSNITTSDLAPVDSTNNNYKKNKKSPKIKGNMYKTMKKLKNKTKKSGFEYSILVNEESE